MGVHLAHSLAGARDAINRRWPRRDKASDGWIGDDAHARRTSDHNPNERLHVDALDVDMFGGATPVHRPSVVAGLICHPATNYVIFERRIYMRKDRFQPRAYNGINPHDKHAHCSIMQTLGAEDMTVPWQLLAALPSWPLLGKGKGTIRQASELQAYLNAWGAALQVDGKLGPLSDKAIRAFQRRRGLAVDGLVGPKTRARIFG